MKTISELNSKAWYRALKIIYILIFIFTAIFVIILFSVDGLFSAEVDDEGGFHVECNNGTIIHQSTLRQNGIDINSDIGNFLLPFSTDDSKIRKFCSRNHSVTDEKNYAFVQDNTGRNWKKITGTLMLISLIIVFFFEAIKRIFYYIISGSLKPKK